MINQIFFYKILHDTGTQLYVCAGARLQVDVGLRAQRCALWVDRQQLGAAIPGLVDELDGYSVGDDFIVSPGQIDVTEQHIFRIRAEEGAVE